ncbi:hypothetical protein KTT_43920 [Tengunoibacter tsumagoiensis]|uniref:Uncharacterized protein n=1 Tax=Tengunoibacter tsumagoiensis TaxID=2014871 RepID=A0A402A5V8_9CHLR|nr:hypothetical protein KTT_43920 [Tengunoibacter tsumagoiensis]
MLPSSRDTMWKERVERKLDKEAEERDQVGKEAAFHTNHTEPGQEGSAKGLCGYCDVSDGMTDWFCSMISSAW